MLIESESIVLSMNTFWIHNSTQLLHETGAHEAASVNQVISNLIIN